MPYRKITKPDVEQIIALSREHLSYRAVGRRLDISAATVRRILLDHAPDLAVRKTTSLILTERVPLSQAQAILDGGLSLRAAAKLLDVTHGALLYWEKKGLLRYRRSPRAETNRFVRGLRPRMTAREWDDFMAFRRAHYTIPEALGMVSRLDLVPSKTVQPERHGGPRGECDATMRTQLSSPDKGSEPCPSLAAS